MNLSDLGEFGFINRIAVRYPASHPSIVKGIGDDAAVLRFSPEAIVLFTTDQLIEGVHFRLENTDAWNLGWKSLAVNLSDIAAMGGTPVGFTLSLGIPAQRISVDYLDRFYEGLFALAKETGVHLLGGDTAESGGAFFISLSVLGTSPQGRVVYRSGGRDIDDLYVTGWLGEAALGLAIIEQGTNDELLQPLVDRHVRPVPRLREGQWLAARGIAHAMIDVSDGLLADTNHLALESRLGAEIDLARIPLSLALQTHAGRYGSDPAALALGGGEDYELLFSAAPEKREEVIQLKTECSCPVTRIGRLARDIEGIVLKDKQGRTRKAEAAGYDHFRK